MVPQRVGIPERVLQERGHRCPGGSVEEVQKKAAGEVSLL